MTTVTYLFKGIPIKTDTPVLDSDFKNPAAVEIGFGDGIDQTEIGPDPENLGAAFH